MTPRRPRLNDVDSKATPCRPQVRGSNLRCTFRIKETSAQARARDLVGAGGSHGKRTRAWTPAATRAKPRPRRRQRLRSDEYSDSYVRQGGTALALWAPDPVGRPTENSDGE
eukprot:CAMPEP_0185840728 /NCGR_PEP_ID=MMETSP1353-20130828/16693_1 /TAXON_ID=1077150 /ORGANISM="Erythrolobus australicus, Strain CCMP3124" /LENGTH=111 /DNA_ID=CAMNT_0028540097 /DNA_START=91 /DNA_END=427 /DNA_ORIENTATION=+